MSKIAIMTYVYCDKKNNRKVLLDKCLQSVALQNYPDYVHVLVDDGSNVSLYDLIHKYPNIKYIRKTNTGILRSTKTFNTGLKYIREQNFDYAIILSSDDVQTNNCLQVLSAYLDRRPKLAGVVGSVRHQTYRGGKLVVDTPTIKSGTVNKNKLMMSNFINGCACMFRVSALRKIDLPPDQTGMAADWDLWVRLSEVGKIHMIPWIVVKYRNFGNAMRCYKFKKDKMKTAIRKKCRQFVIDSAKKRRGKK